jgi:7-keto-8-aminopelargonate synthetase-like enzyme
MVDYLAHFGVALTALKDERCYRVFADLERHGIYIQPVNYPTVPRGTERPRITPEPLHDARLVAKLTTAMVAVWKELELPFDLTREHLHR